MKPVRDERGVIREVILTGAELVSLVRRLLDKAGERFHPDVDVILKFETADYPVSDPLAKGERYAKRTEQTLHSGDRGTNQQEKLNGSSLSTMRGENYFQSELNLGRK